jgi:DnaK suppressor protein
MGKAELNRYKRVLNEVLDHSDRPPSPGDAAERRPDLDEQAAVDHAVYVECIDKAIRHDRRVAARRALDRMHEGSYGLCSDCGEPISPKRLAAVPWAERCVPCQSRWEIQALPKCA